MVEHFRRKLNEVKSLIEFDQNNHTYYHKGKQKYYQSVSERLRFKEMYLNDSIKNGLIRGHEIHKWAEQYDLGVNPTEPEEWKGYLEAYKKYVTENQPTYIAVESIVISDSWATAGTIDRVIMNADGSISVLDIKTGSYNAKNELQLEFYMLMLRAVLRVKKPIKKLLLYLTNDGEYTLREVH